MRNPHAKLLSVAGRYPVRVLPRWGGECGQVQDAAWAHVMGMEIYQGLGVRVKERTD